MAINSENITIFPCVSRTIKDNYETATKAKLMSEENITNIIKSITDKDSYIISRSNSNLFKFVLEGYYIRLQLPIDESVTDIYVSLNYQSNTGNHTLLQGDTNNIFNGIDVLTNKNNLPEYDLSNYFCLLKDGSIPEESCRKFNKTSISFDFGELN